MTIASISVIARRVQLHDRGEGDLGADSILEIVDLEDEEIEQA
jgi:hypothetical protein